MWMRNWETEKKKGRPEKRGKFPVRPMGEPLDKY